MHRSKQTKTPKPYAAVAAQRLSVIRIQLEVSWPIRRVVLWTGVRRAGFLVQIYSSET